jgi:hypothetical protein
MDEKKLNSLITTLLKMSVEQEKPGKYNTVIAELLKAEGVNNVVIMDHRGGTVVSYNNAQGGITLLGE